MTRGRYRWALAVVAVSAFMTTMDNTVVFTALPTIMADLDMSSSAKDWVATGYILMFSCLMITGGRLTDVFGCRLTFTSGMVVFTAASAVCGLAQSSDVLILARIVQGAGAALALPATQVMVTVGRTDKQRSIGNIIFIGAASGATALGPTIGGIIVQHWHWGWIFLINIVPGILVILLGLFTLTGHGENKHSRIDLPGVLISATMLFAFIYALEVGNKHGWTDPSVLSVFALGLIALVCFIVVESWAPDPMIDLRFFRNRVFTGGLMSQMLYGIGFNGMMFYSQPFLQRFLGFSPPEAGLVMLPPAIAIIVLTPLAFLMATKVGPRPAIGFGMALMGLGMVLFSRLKVGDGYADLMPGVMLVGVGAALGMPLVMYVLKAVPEKRAGVASGVINVIREASGAFGIAIVGLLVHHVPDPAASAADLETFRAGTSSGLILGAILVLIGGLISGITLPSRRGWLGPKHGKTSPIVPDTPKFDPTATPRDPIPALVAPLATPVTVASGAPPDAPLPIPLTWEDDPMPDDAVPTPAPGPHWWTDNALPAPDASQDDDRPVPSTPWPAPPTAPPATTAPPPAAAPPPVAGPPPLTDPPPVGGPAPAQPPPVPAPATPWDDWPAPETPARPTTPIPALPPEPPSGQTTPHLPPPTGTPPPPVTDPPAAPAAPWEPDDKADKADLKPDDADERLVLDELAGTTTSWASDDAKDFEGPSVRASWNPADAEQDVLGENAAESGAQDGIEGADDEDGDRPAPPQGWYEPYVPEEEPAEDPQVTPRNDAW
ncbi:MFS transporter [Actinomadura monticuli]|uniref:DHA2 family efflux MFS transporter permease subunit n=1 Tax=Actinomadura monticuli TaxID=3097367 RepID=A0ABV4QEC7_9ACTN